MTEEIVLDSNVLVVSLLDEDVLNEEEKKQRPMAIKYIEGLRRGDYRINLPRIAVVEVCGAVSRRAGVGKAGVTKIRLTQWTEQGFIKLHDLDQSGMNSATDLSITYNRSLSRSLSGADATFAALAEELDVNFITVEKYINKDIPKLIRLVPA